MGEESSSSIALLVDDQPEQLRLMQAILRDHDLTFLTASNGQEAIELALSFAPKFVFCDIEMPGFDGLEFCRKLRAACLEGFCYVTLLSGDTAPRKLTECLDAGADLFIPKPYHRQDLLACIRAGLRQEILHNRLKSIALADPLTGLPTRAHFDVEAQSEFERARRQELQLSCAVIDADFFKNINDTKGHAAGDAVLCELARVLESAVRLNDFACRFGGEEFCVLLPGTDEQGAKAWADRVRQRIEEARVEFDGEELRVTASVGVASMSGECQGPLDIFVKADQALLMAKQTGRNRVVAQSEVSQTDGDAVIPSDQDPFWELPAGDVMSALVATLSSEESLRTAAELFLRFRINAAPVVDGDGNLEGILSEKDIMSRMVRCGVWETTVGKAMKSNVISYDASTPLRIIHAFLCRAGIRRVVILRDGLPCGIIGRGTLLRAYRNWVQQEESQTDATSAAESDSQGVVESLVAQVQQLQGEFDDSGIDTAPAVIHRVSRIQELSKDLLVAVRTDDTTSDNAFDG